MAESSWLGPERHRRGSPDVRSGCPPHRVEVDGEVRTAREQLLQRHPGLQARGSGTQAVVVALAEGQQLAGATAYVELVGVRAVAARVAVGGAVQQEHAAALGDDGVVQLDLADD